MLMLIYIIEVIVIFFLIFVVYCMATNLRDRVDRYPLSRVDESKMLSDKVMNNLSDRQVQRNMVNGKYDKK